MNSNLLCKICESTENLRKCSVCRTIWYCSKDHQKLHWNNSHKFGECLYLRNKRDIRNHLKSDGFKSEDFLLFKQKADYENDKISKNIVGKFYLYGFGVEINETEALKYFYSAKKDCVLEAYHNLGVCHFHGYGVPVNKEKAVHYFRQAAEEGFPLAQYELGLCYSEGEGVILNNATALSWYKKAVSGDVQIPMAQVNIGVFHHNGYGGVKKDASEAFVWYKKAADQGQSEGLYKVATCYQYGEGVESNMSEMIRYLKLAFEKGNLDAAYSLGLQFFDGVNIPIDLLQASKCFQKGANFGNTNAQTNLGLCFYKQNNFIDAIKWYRRASGLGNATATYNLGVCYSKGEGVTKDLEMSFNCYKLAADQGSIEAFYDLGVCYDVGLGTLVNKIEAASFFKKANKLGITRNRN